MQAGPCRRVEVIQGGMPYGQVRGGWSNISAVRRNGHPVSGRKDTHRGASHEQLRQEADVVQRLVHHHNERHAALGGHTPEEHLERLEAASGRPDPHDGEACGCWWWTGGGRLGARPHRRSSCGGSTWPCSGGSALQRGRGLRRLLSGCHVLPIPAGQAPLVVVGHSSETRAPWDSCLLRVLPKCNRFGKQSKRVS